MKEEIENAVKALKEGKVILYPTDTIWGLGCDPTNDKAVSRVFEVKQREDHKALIILIGEIGQLYNYVENIPEIAWDIIEFAEKPLTVVFSKGKNISPRLLAQDGTIAIRLVRDEFCKKLISRFGKGIVSTSANISGNPSPENFSQITQSIKENVDYVVDYRRNDMINLPPSTIIRLEHNGEIKFIRK